MKTPALLTTWMLFASLLVTPHVILAGPPPTAASLLSVPLWEANGPKLPPVVRFGRVLSAELTRVERH